MISKKLTRTVRRLPTGYKHLSNRYDSYRVTREGWYLFGWLPLCVWDVTVEKM